MPCSIAVLYSVPLHTRTLSAHCNRWTPWTMPLNGTAQVAASLLCAFSARTGDKSCCWLCSWKCLFVLHAYVHGLFIGSELICRSLTEARRDIGLRFGFCDNRTIAHFRYIDLLSFVVAIVFTCFDLTLFCFFVNFVWDDRTLGSRVLHYSGHGSDEYLSFEGRSGVHTYAYILPVMNNAHTCAVGVFVCLCAVSLMCRVCIW